MCIHFNLVKICITTEQAMFTMEKGPKTANFDFPLGTVYGYGELGNVFIFRHSRLFNTNDRLGKGPHRFYRDHWRHLAAGSDSQYGKSLLEAKHVVIGGE